MKKINESFISVGLLSVLIVGLVFALSGCGLINQEPEAKISVTSHSASGGSVSLTVGEILSVSGSNSEANGGEINDYDWDFKFNESGSSSDTTSTNETASYTYDKTGSYTVQLTVTDDNGKTDSTSITVSVSEEELAASFTISPNPAEQDETVTLSATTTGTFDSYTWYYRTQTNSETIPIQTGSTTVNDVDINLQTPSKIAGVDTVPTGKNIFSLTISNSNTQETYGEIKTLIVE